MNTSEAVGTKKLKGKKLDKEIDFLELTTNEQRINDDKQTQTNK